MNKTEFHAEINRITTRASEEIAAVLKKSILADIQATLFGGVSSQQPDVSGYLRKSRKAAEDLAQDMPEPSGKVASKKSKKAKAVPAKKEAAKKSKGASNADENRAKVMDFVRKNPGTNGIAIQNECGLSKEGWRYARETLNDRGELRIEGERRDAIYFAV